MNAIKIISHQTASYTAVKVFPFADVISIQHGLLAVRELERDWGNFASSFLQSQLCYRHASVENMHLCTLVAARRLTKPMSKKAINERRAFDGLCDDMV